VDSLVATLVTVATLPDSVTRTTELANEVERTVEVAALSVVAWRPALALVIVSQEVEPGSKTVEVLVKLVMVALTVRVVVPAARASRPRRKKRAAGVGAQVIVVFFVVTWVDVDKIVLVCALAVVVLTTRTPDSEIVLVVLTPFWVLVM
jgi:hypothetical protein